MSQSFEEFTNGKYTTPETVESLERATRYANLQIAIERVLCTYINETDASEQLPITQIDFEHHGARVSVKVEMGEAAVKNISEYELVQKAISQRDNPDPIVRQFATMQALAGDGEICKAGCQCGRSGECSSGTCSPSKADNYETNLAKIYKMTHGQLIHLMSYHPTSGKGEDEILQKREETLACNDPLHLEMDWDGREFLKSTVMGKSFHEHAEELRVRLQREVNRLFFPSLTFSVSYDDIHSSTWRYSLRTKTSHSEYEYISQELDGLLENPSWVQRVARDVLDDFRKRDKQCKRCQDETEVYNQLLADQKKIEQELSSTEWRANSMYTSREDQERYGNG